MITSNLKLYRKFLILAVLLTGVFFAAQSNRVAAQPCCDSCESFYTYCEHECDVSTKTQAQYEACMAAECDPYYNWCISHCSYC